MIKHNNAADRRILSNELICDGFWPVRRISYSAGAGTVPIDREIHVAHDAAAVLPFDPARGCVLLIRQFRLPPFVEHNVASLIEVCAGVCEAHESPDKCAIRETLEETGLTIAAPRLIGRIYPSPGVCTERISLFIASYDQGAKTSDGGGLAEEAEEIEPFEIGLSEAVALIERGEIMDAKTIILLQRLAMEQGLSAGAL